MNKNISSRITILLLFTIAFIICSFGFDTNHRINNQTDEVEKIRNVIHTSIRWAKNKDINLLYSVIANDTSFFEVHPYNRIVKGFEEFRKAEKFWMSPDFKAISYEIKDLQINVSKSGDVAWWFCMLDDINEWKGEPANWENTRWTGVLEKREGHWVIVQQHFSFARE